MSADPEPGRARARARQRWGTDPAPGRRPATFALRAAAPRLAAVAGYALAMAYVEAAAVLYIRTLYGGVDPTARRAPVFDVPPSFGGVEFGREAATMVMLATVGWLAAPRPAGRWAAFLLAFGVWDIGYYAFLWLFAGWPTHPLASDVLFLIPLPWWGPVVSPLLLALVMVAGGAAALAREAGTGLPRPDGWAWLALGGGAIVCLVAFMFNALRLLPSGMELAQAARGGAFPWPLYLVGLALCAAGAYRTVTAPARAV
jgi:hypothetical protein